MSKHLRREDGVADVEFGLILPVLVLILLGIVDYGYAFMVKLTLTNAAREGARVGVTLPEDDSAPAAEAWGVGGWLWGAQDDADSIDQQQFNQEINALLGSDPEKWFPINNVSKRAPEASPWSPATEFP